MDGYPSHLTPFDEGGVKTPFDMWWSRVKPAFPAVPEIIAKDWLHRHWGTSPFGWVTSLAYDFTLGNMPSRELPHVLSRVYGFERDNLRAIDTGRHLCGDHPGVPDRPWRDDAKWLVHFMKTKGSFPTPITILDNRDNHLAAAHNIPQPARAYPQGLILTEGHTRHVIGLYLQSIGQLNDVIPICRLTFKGGNQV